jgi:tetratricopeptide (TPR) repeat protein
MKTDRLVAWVDGRGFQEHPTVPQMAERFRAATAAYNAGDYEAGIARLREAYEIGAASGIGCEAPECLRLPRYLQKAGRSAEAWEELQSLLSPDHVVLRYGKYMLPVNHWRIYDNIRLFLQRDGKPALAACYAVLSYLCEVENCRSNIADCREHHISARRFLADLRMYGDRVFIEDALIRDTKRAGLVPALPRAVDWVRSILELPLLPDDNVLLAQIRTVLGVTEEYP